MNYSIISNFLSQIRRKEQKKIKEELTDLVERGYYLDSLVILSKLKSNSNDTAELILKIIKKENYYIQRVHIHTIRNISKRLNLEDKLTIAKAIREKYTKVDSELYKYISYILRIPQHKQGILKLILL